MEEPAFPSVDISPFTQHGDTAAKEKAAAELTSACHRFGFASIHGHGLSEGLLYASFSVSKDLFNLSHEDKMKAPHPAGPVPHRGYSAPGVEKVYGAAESEHEEVAASNGESLRKVEDFKESYEIGSEENKTQYNIWLPESTLPGFQSFTTDLYWQLNQLARHVLDAFATGLKLTMEERQYLMTIHTGHNNQLRLLHYPAVPSKMLESSIMARMPAHTDWSFFTMLFQDDVGGLELEDPSRPGTFLPANPVPGAVVLNIGDMLMRLTNGFFTSANHRVTIPPAIHTKKDTGERLTPERYSIPYFVAPDDSAVIETFKTCVPDGMKSQFTTLKFENYAEFRAKHSYRLESKS